MRRIGWAVLALAGLAAAVATPLFAGNDDLRQAERAVKAAVRSQKLPALDRAIGSLRQIGGPKAAGALLGWAKRMPPGQEQLYWRFVNGAASFRDAPALAKVQKTIVRGKSLGRDLLYALQNNRSQSVPETVLGPVLKKAPLDLALMAADQLAAIEAVEAVDALIAGLRKRREATLKDRIDKALQHLTGADCGDADGWKQWWATARAQGVQGRKRRGRSTGTVVDTLDDPFDEIKELGRMDPSWIWVMTTDCKRKPVACNFDDMGALLQRMEIPFTPVTKQQFEKGEVTLDKVRVILLTCTQIHDHCVCPSCKSGTAAGNRMVRCVCTSCPGPNVNHKLSGDAVKKLKAWVERGGYFFSEDWGIQDFLQPAWPKIVRSGKMLAKRSVRVVPGRGQTTHPLLKGVFLNPEAAKRSEGKSTVTREEDGEGLAKIERFWQIDDESPWIQIVAKTQVAVLMRSNDLSKDAGPEGNAVAITFLSGGARGEAAARTGALERIRGGRVLHVLSHFGKQQSNEDEFALQNLLLNFLIEASRRAPASARKAQ